MQKFLRPRRHRGFTLIEILVVLVILGLLAGLVGPRLFGKVDSSKVKTASTQVKMLKTALQTFRLDIGRYPSTEEGLAVLSGRPQGGELAAWAGPYLEEALPVDPWGTPLQWSLREGEPRVTSLGADGAPGGAGDDADVIAD